MEHACSYHYKHKWKNICFKEAPNTIYILFSCVCLDSVVTWHTIYQIRIMKIKWKQKTYSIIHRTKWTGWIKARNGKLTVRLALMEMQIISWYNTVQNTASYTIRVTWTRMNRRLQPKHQVPWPEICENQEPVVCWTYIFQCWESTKWLFEKLKFSTSWQNNFDF